MEKLSLTQRLAFRTMSLIHEDLYLLIRNPEKTLKAAGIRTGQQVLEVGCGPGFFTGPAARLLEPGGRLVTLDINPLATQRVAEKVRDSGARNVEILLKDAAETGLPSGHFDLAFVFGVSWRGAGREDAYQELYRVLKPDGILAIEGRQCPPESLFVLQGRTGMIRRYGRA